MLKLRGLGFIGVSIQLILTLGRTNCIHHLRSLTISSLQTADPCPADQPDYRVAIAVGIVLLILIVIVVVAYIIGRRKRTDGYQSL